MARRFSDREAIRELMNGGYEPLEKYPGSQTPWKAKCMKCGRIAKPFLSNVIQGKRCKHCRGLAVREKARIVKLRELELSPLEPYKNSSSKWKLKCLRCETEFEQTWRKIWDRGYGCRICQKRKIYKYSDEMAIEQMLKRGFEPLEPYKNVHRVWECKCLNCGKISKPTLHGVLEGKICVYCAKIKLDPQDAVLRMKASGFEPLVDYPGARKSWKSKCLICGKISSPKLYNATKRGWGCIYCAEGGFSMNNPALLYIVVNYELNAVKVGVGGTETKNKRVQRHAMRGWETYRTYSYSNGELAYKMEQNILTWLKKELGLTNYLSIKEMPQGGWTETFDLDRIQPDEIIKHFKLNII